MVWVGARCEQRGVASCKHKVLSPLQSSWSLKLVALNEPVVGVNESAVVGRTARKVWAELPYEANIKYLDRQCSGSCCWSVVW
jgi:hypothetical protein